ncbi:hypothetical protein PVAP13_9KG028256 [Panicum virgatum]|uniref:Uncharacterized protein n=1 Tax=Panicum virgatum TaxID=38727 RepID=A0A8T0NGV6_PANVG|nr:hypothetical protein PVAP13_9KG028256 [Panicum virgatum]
MLDARTVVVDLLRSQGLTLASSTRKVGAEGTPALAKKKRTRRLPPVGWWREGKGVVNPNPPAATLPARRPPTSASIRSEGRGPWGRRGRALPTCPSVRRNLT